MNPMFAAMKGTAMKDKRKRAGGGGGGGGSISMATTAAGNFDNAVKIAILNTSNNTFNFSNGVKDGSASTFGTATSPTRTTQIVSIAASDYLTGWTAAGTGNGLIVIGGYIRVNNFTSSGTKFAWSVPANAIQSQSFATGVAATVFETLSGRSQTQDNTVMDATAGVYGIYENPGQSQNGSGYYVINLVHAAGRGAATLPQAGDNVTFILEVVDGTSPGYSAVHEVTINFV